MKIELTKENYGLNDSSASWDQDQRGDFSSPHDGCHNLHVFFLAKHISSLNLRSLNDTHRSSQAPAKFLSASPSDNVTPHTPPLSGCRTLAITLAKEEVRLIKSGFNPFPSHCQSNSFPVKPNHI